ncbi:MAG: cell division protein FtsZ [Candidatus Cryptobacteroides sp.]
MENLTDFNVVPTTWEARTSTIKVIGVGGGGCNAVDYMFNQHIEGCIFIVCNTDSQALGNCGVPMKIQLGEGLGAGCDPVAGRNAALESEAEIENSVFGTRTDMLFITAGMGGGTGTGAAPVIASMAKKKGVLTVGVVTIPTRSDGNEAMTKALDGIMELEKNVDSLLVIDNEKLYRHYGKVLVQDAYPMSNEVLCTAVKGIIEIIKKKGYINVDFRDVKRMMTNSGMALMGCGTGTGENRIKDAVRGAFESPLLNDHDLTTAKNVLLNITIGHNKDGVTMEELENIDNLITDYIGHANRFKKGIVWDCSEDFGDRINITAIATGFRMDWDGLADDNGNLIVINPDYEYVPVQDENPEYQPDQRSFKIGFNNTEAKCSGDFCKGAKPVLLVDDRNGSITELEDTPAIKRR